MVDNLDYWVEKTYTAMYILATGNGNLSERLNDAWTSSLVRVQLHPNVADELKERFSAIQQRCTIGSDSNRLGIGGLSESDLRQLADDFLSLYERTQRLREERLRPTSR